MTDAPERIYVDPDNIPDGFASKREIVSYVRADLAPAWQPIAAAPMSGETVWLFTTCHGVCEAWFCEGEWSRDSPNRAAEYSGDMWVCCDDSFQIEVCINGLGDGVDDHGTATHFMAPAPSPEGAA